MKVRIFGFGINLGRGIGFRDFFGHLETLNGKQFDNRILTVAKQDAWWLGVLITIKDAKRFCKMQQAGPKYTISAHELEKGTSMVDFNFFAIYEPTGRGLYQHYHLSSHVSTFCEFLKQRYDALKRQKIQDAIEKRTDVPEGVANQAAAKQFAHSLRFTIMCRQESLERCIAQLERVKNMEFEYTSLEFQNDPLTPLTKVAKKRVEKFVFGRTNVDVTKAAVLQFVGKKLSERIRVHGVDPNGVEQVYKLQNDYDTFAEEEYDDVVKTIEMNSDNMVESLMTSPVIEKLLKIANGAAKTLLTTPACE
jgi:hypothetical protein